MKGYLTHTIGGQIPSVSSAAIKEYLLNSLLVIESVTLAFHSIPSFMGEITFQELPMCMSGRIHLLLRFLSKID